MTALVGGDARTPAGPLVAAPRMVRTAIRLDDDHRVQVTVAGRGVPLVAVHGYTGEGLLYAQSLSRLVSSGFKVIAVDTAGHGGTDGLRGGRDISDYAKLLARVVDHLGIGQAVYLGHSMGGRLATEVVANDPRRAIAVLLLDAIVGDTWDTMVQLFRVAPPLWAATGLGLAVDTLSTFPVAKDPRQALKLGRLWAPVLGHNVRRPWHVLGAGVSILRSGPTRWMLEQLADQRVPLFAIHGDRDMGVPHRTAADAARRANGMLVTVHGATHSWPLKDPETLPAIFAELLQGRLGEAVRLAQMSAGLSPSATLAEVESAFYRPGARVRMLTPPLEFHTTGERRARPRYRWTCESFASA